MCTSSCVVITIPPPSSPLPSISPPPPLPSPSPLSPLSYPSPPPLPFPPPPLPLPPLPSPSSLPPLPSPSQSTGPTLAPATGEDMFRTGDPFSGSSSHISNSSSSSSLPPIAPASNLATVDPFSGQDPFKTDPFGSASKETSVQVSPEGMSDI